MFSWTCLSFLDWYLSFTKEIWLKHPISLSLQHLHIQTHRTYFCRKTPARQYGNTSGLLQEKMASQQDPLKVNLLCPFMLYTSETQDTYLVPSLSLTVHHCCVSACSSQVGSTHNWHFVAFFKKLRSLQTKSWKQQNFLGKRQRCLIFLAHWLKNGQWCFLVHFSFAN